MAEVLSECRATSHGEKELARQLSSMDDAHLKLMFTLDFIPGMRESDLLLIHEHIGVFIIEAKTFGIGALESVSPTQWKVSGRSSSESPILQAYRQYEGLRDFLGPIYGRLPFICATVCFPKISRREFLARFGSSQFVQSVSKSIIFSEDIFSGEHVFRERLSHIVSNPPSRQGKPPCRVPERFISELKSLMTPVTPNVPTMSERDRLRSLESGITRELQKQYPVGGARTGVFSGHPGTGKTFRLLSIGCFHAYSGQSVLFTCFNKTLASDIRRLLSFNEKLQASQGRVDVLDINQLALRCFDTNGMGFFECKDADEWGELLVAELSEKDDPIIEKFDVVLVDEVQDMKSWQLDLLTLHTGRQATVALAMGKGQELYRDAASAEQWLSAIDREKNPQKHALRRNFRNPQLQFLVAKAFHDCWPDKYHRIGGIFRAGQDKSNQAELSFDRKDGEQPRYITLPVDSAEFENGGQFQDEIVADSFASVLEGTFNRLDDDPNLDPVGLLVLVPETEGLHCRAARIVLEKICEARGVSFIDYTKENSRRSSARQDQARLCTFHSARGLEGEHVVVFGFERLEHLSEKSDAPPENIAFVVLSRGVFSSTIVCRNEPRIAVHELCERVWREMNAS